MKKLTPSDMGKLSQKSQAKKYGKGWKKEKERRAALAREGRARKRELVKRINN